MKKKIFVFIVIALLLPLNFIFSACEIIIKDKNKIDFIVDNSIYATIETNGNEELNFPENPIKENYIFDGWYYDNVTFSNEFNILKFRTENLEKNIRVYCKWTKNFKINYVLNGGINNPLNPIKIESDKEYCLYFPTREYFDFVGWYTESSFENKVEKIQNIDNDITLYAKWKLNGYNFGIIDISGEGSCFTTLPYTLTDTFLPGETITIPLLFKLAKASEPAYYLVGIKDEKNILEPAFYFVCGTVTYVIKNNKTYVLSDSANFETPGIENYDQYVGCITSGQLIEIVIQSKVNDKYSGKINPKITCTIALIQQANLTQENAKTLLLDEILKN